MFKNIKRKLKGIITNRKINKQADRDIHMYSVAFREVCMHSNKKKSKLIKLIRYITKAKTKINTTDSKILKKYDKLIKEIEKELEKHTIKLHPIIERDMHIYTTAFREIIKHSKNKRRALEKLVGYVSTAQKKATQSKDIPKEQLSEYDMLLHDIKHEFHK